MLLQEHRARNVIVNLHTISRRLPISIGALASLLFLTGCGDSDTYVSFGGKAAGQPVFCISARPNCAAPGASISTLVVDEIDEAGNNVQTMWQVNSTNNLLNTQYNIVYGSLPLGWAQAVPARQLVAGHHYRVNNQYYFSLTANGLIFSENGAAQSKSQ